MTEAGREADLDALGHSGAGTMVSIRPSRVVSMAHASAWPSPVVSMGMAESHASTVDSW